MPQFFFDFREGQDLSRDVDGLEFANVEEAYLEAYEGAREMWAELLAKRRDPRRCAFEVRDAGGELLFIFPFQEVIDSCSAPDRARHPLHTSFEHATASANRAKRACEAFSTELSSMRRTLTESRALLLAKV